MPATSRRHVLSRLVLGVSLCAALWGAASSVALAAGFERGPAPTKAALEAAGPYTVTSFGISRADGKAYDHGGATVYYPANGTETYGLVALAPGFIGSQSVYAPLAQRIASHGFVVINLDTITLLDQPNLRAKALAGALKQVTQLVITGKTAFTAKVDTSRQAVVGHSMGGGGTLIAATADASLKAAVPITPWNLSTRDFSKDQVPTLVLSCEKDVIAPNAQHSYPFFSSLSPSLPSGQVEIGAADHFCPTTLAKAAYQTSVSKAVIAWLKRFVDDDARYDALVKGGINGGDYIKFSTQGF
jgi:dienelactone hydrolase